MSAAHIDRRNRLGTLYYIEKYLEEVSSSDSHRWILRDRNYILILSNDVNLLSLPQIHYLLISEAPGGTYQKHAAGVELWRCDEQETGPAGALLLKRDENSCTLCHDTRSSLSKQTFPARRAPLDRINCCSIHISPAGHNPPWAQTC